MKNCFAVAALIACFALPQISSAAGLGSAASQPTELRLADGSSNLLKRLGIGHVAKAHAAECTPEGETCTSNEQCCPGLECSGGPPATCSTQD